MALYTRLWAASKHESQSIIVQPISALTIQAALELINTTSTPTHTEIKLAYSLWENQLQSKTIANRTFFKHQLSV